MKKGSELQLVGKEDSHARPSSRFSLEGLEEGVWSSEYETDVLLAGVEMDLDNGSINSLAATLQLDTISN